MLILALYYLDDFVYGIFICLTNLIGSMKGKVYWIVGASSGIGEYLAYEVSCEKFLNLQINMPCTEYMLLI